MLHWDATSLLWEGELRLTTEAGICVLLENGLCWYNRQDKPAPAIMHTVIFASYQHFQANPCHGIVTKVLHHLVKCLVHHLDTTYASSSYILRFPYSNWCLYQCVLVTKPQAMVQRHSYDFLFTGTAGTPFSKTWHSIYYPLNSTNTLRNTAMRARGEVEN